MKKIISLSLILLGFVSCSHEEEKSSENKPVVVEEIKDKDTSILGGYSSFEVEVNGTPYNINTIASMGYRGAKSSYGFSPYINFEINDDNSVDVLWLDKSETSSAGRKLTKISLDTKSFVKNIPVPAVANVRDSWYLNFCGLKNGDYIVGYSQPNKGPNDVRVYHDAVYTRFDESGSVKFSGIGMSANFGDGFWNPGTSSTSQIIYNKKENVLGLYSGRHGYGGHQAGWIAFMNASTGEPIKDSKGQNSGDEWYISHSFDQRILIPSHNSKKYYTLAHGDSGNNRALLTEIWDQEVYLVTGNGTRYRYFDKIPDNPGNNNYTGTRTGDFIELPNGNVAVIYCTEHGRKQRDLKLVILGGMQANKPSTLKEAWVTENTENFVGWGMQMHLYGNDKILLAWNVFKDEKTAVGTYFALADLNGNIISKIEEYPEALLNHGQSMKITKDGKKLVFVSAGSGNKLKINTINIK
ncbi:hypothetical protein Flavo103_21190 [Flavobacterium collinsii]|uniref:hypothetical protein n=1 Tax=Flavobacterium collinsii TaxID=1114861 RepID=UPI0022CB5C4E|nr:hypothetical protein [Flavobacterium collinsii]GIQ58983.1 hypothetical protein Flavo103_21190 [Flavobacterium collinsii]